MAPGAGPALSSSRIELAPNAVSDGMVEVEPEDRLRRTNDSVHLGGQD